MENLRKALSEGGAFNALTKYPQFILWKAVQKGKKTTKLPIDHRNLQTGNAHDPEVWMDSKTAIAVAEKSGKEYGVGFVFTENDPFFLLDVDNCYDTNTKAWSKLSSDLINMLPMAAIEVSQSKQGLHIIACGRVPNHACKNIPLNIEFYTEGRFVALTGIHARGNVSTDLTSKLVEVVKEYFPLTVAESTQVPMWTQEAVPEWDGLLEDDDLIERACASKSAKSHFGGHASFKDLWVADEEALARTYAPSSEIDTYNASSADAALAQHLAFWTGKNCERIKRLMLASGLERSKWMRKDYLARTILKAVSIQVDVHVGTKSPLQVPKNELLSPELVQCVQQLNGEQQIKHFDGLVYVTSQDRVLTKRGLMLDQKRFNVAYGGYLFQHTVLDDKGKAKWTSAAWSAFTQSQLVRWPVVDGACFRPLLQERDIVIESGLRLINTYVPCFGMQIEGDVTPFLNHVKLLIPDEADQKIFLSFLAACVQRVGVKFQWAPLLQGVEGNGKTLFYYVLAYALGERYAHLPNAADITNRFTGWLEGKLFICIEEAHIAGNQAEADFLKAMITNKRIEIQNKGEKQYTGDNQANFMLCSNHKDAVLKHANDRRYCMFYTAQQDVSDLIRDGMDDQYFDSLYDWLETGGFARVAHYLANYTVSVNVMGRAPATSSASEAICSNLGGAEQILHEAIDLELFGFGGDLICTAYAREHLKSHGEQITPQKIAGILNNLGYIRHPGLDCSRGAVRINGILRRLYVKKGSETALLNTPKSIAEAFNKTQRELLAGKSCMQL